MKDGLMLFIFISLLFKQGVPLISNVSFSREPCMTRSAAITPKSYTDNTIKQEHKKTKQFNTKHNYKLEKVIS